MGRSDRTERSAQVEHKLTGGRLVAVRLEDASDTGGRSPAKVCALRRKASRIRRMRAEEDGECLLS
jgi:hypothetical protein